GFLPGAAGTAVPAGRACLGRRLLVDDAAAGDVDEAGTGLGGLEVLGAAHAAGLGSLGHVHGDEVGHGQQSGQVEDLDAHLRGPSLRDVGIVADQPHAGGLRALGGESADAAEPDDAEGVGVVSDAGVLLPVPLP